MPTHATFLTLKLYPIAYKKVKTKQYYIRTHIILTKQKSQYIGIFDKNSPFFSPQEGKNRNILGFLLSQKWNKWLKMLSKKWNKWLKMLSKKWNKWIFIFMKTQQKVLSPENQAVIVFAENPRQKCACLYFFGIYYTIPCFEQIIKGFPQQEAFIVYKVQFIVNPQNRDPMAENMIWGSGWFIL